jgi:hypothetical protein
VPSQAVDWTVDKVLSGIATLNARDAAARSAITQARASYTQAVRGVSLIPDQATQAAVRAQLTDWIHKQVGIENQYQDFHSRLLSAKAAVKGWLKSVDITPPGYLGIAILAPIAIGAAIAVALGIVAAIVITATSHGRKMDSINALIGYAQRNGWTAAQLDAAIRNINAGDKPPDPTGITGALQAALPLALVVGAIVLVGPMLKRRMA